MKITCITCKIIFEGRRVDQKYCPECRDKSDKERAKKNWEDFRRRKGRKVGCGSGNNQGSGKSHHSYKTGIYNFQERYLESLGGNFLCKRCEKDLTDSIEGGLRKHCVHHIDEDRTNNELNNFELLCKRCHQLNHNCKKNLPNKITPQEGIVQD